MPDNKDPLGILSVRKDPLGILVPKNGQPTPKSGQSILYRPSETPEQKQQRYDAVKNNDAVSLATNYDTESKKPLESKYVNGNFVGIDVESRNQYKQSREGKTGEIVSGYLNRGKIEKDDLKYLNQVAPMAAAQIVASAVPKVAEKGKADDADIEAFVTIFPTVKRDASLKNTSGFYKDINTKALTELTTQGFDPKLMSSEYYLTQFRNGLEEQRTVEIGKLQSEFPIEFVPQTAPGYVGPAAVNRNKEYYAAEKVLNEKYDKLFDSLGRAAASNIADKNKDELTVGLEYLKYKDPGAYKNRTTKGIDKSSDDRTWAEIGSQVKIAKEQDLNAIEQLINKQDKLDELHPDKLKAETKHRLGAELYKGDNWFLNFNQSIEAKDKAAEQLPKKYRDAYYKYIRPTEIGLEAAGKFAGGIFGALTSTDIPRSGAINQLVQGAESVATSGVLGVMNLAGARSKKDVIQDMLDSPYKTRFQNVGEMAQAQSRLSELNNRVKAGETLDVNDLEEKRDLETFTNVRSSVQKAIDGGFNLAGQVIMQGLGTKGLGGVMGLGLKSAGLLKAAQVATDISSKYAISENALFNVAGAAVAFTSSYDDANQQAIRLYPEDENKQAIYSTAVAGLNALTERLFKDEKVFDAFKKEVAPNIANLVKQLGSGEIKKELLFPTLKGIIKDGLKLGKYTLIENTKETAEEVATSIGTSVTNLLLSPSKFNFNEAYDDAVNTATTMFTDGALVALFAGAKEFRANKLGINTLSQLGVNESFTQDVKGVIAEQVSSGVLTQAQADEKLKVINTIAQTNTVDMPQVVEGSNLKDRQAKKYAIALSYEKLLQEKINATTDEALKAKYQDDIFKSKELRKKILNKEVFVDDNYEVLTPEEAKAKEAAKATADTTLVMPTADIMAQDTKDGKVVTYTYATQDEIPEEFKNRITDVKTENGNNVITVSVPLSLDNYIKTKNATTTSQGQEQEITTTGDISQREGTQGEQNKETTESNIGYSFIVSEEGDEIPIAALINKKVRVNGQPAILYIEGQRIVARVLGTNRILDTFGNYKEMMNALPSEYGIEIEDTIVSETPTGYRVGKDELVNNNENKLDAISVDGNGNVMNVVLYTPSGKRRKFRDKAARDLAYQIRLKEILQDEEQFEQFLESEHQAELDAAAAKQQQLDEAESKRQAELDARKAEDAAKGETDGDNGTVSETKKVTPAFGVITSENLDELDKIEANKLQRKVLNDVKNVVKAINKLIKATTGRTLQVHVHNQKSFEDAVIEAGGTREDSTARGFYLGSNGTIHLNMDNVNTDTMLHEGFHPVLDLMQELNPSFIRDAFKQLSNIPEAAGSIQDAKDLYDGELTQMKEAITDFVAGIADGRIVINKTNLQKIKTFISNLLKSIGIGRTQLLENIDSPQKLINLADSISFTFKKGFGNTFDKMISQYEDASGNRMSVRQAQFALNNDFSDVNTKTTFSYLQNQAEFDKLKADGFITEDKTLDDFVGKMMIVHRPDAAFTGTISKNGQLLVEGNGGVFYPVRFHEDGYFWASTDAAAIKMAKMLNEMLKENGGVIYMALVSSPSDKLLSSTTASNAVMDFFSSVAIDNLLGLDKKTVAKAIINAATKTVLKETVVTNKDGTEKLDPVTNEPVYRLKKVGLKLDFERILRTRNVLNSFKKKPLIRTTVDNIPLEEVKKIVREKLANDKSAFPDRKLFSKTLIEEVVKQIKGTPAEQALGKFFNEGQFNDSYKQTKKISKGYDLSGTNVVQSLAEMFTEPMLKGMASKQAYAVLEIKGEVAPVKSDKHESYGMAIESKGKNKTTVHILKERELWTDRFEDPETGESIKGKRESKVLPPTNGITPKAVRVLPKKGLQLQRTAPNGKPSKLNAKQYEQVRTPAFKKWFGDWEKDPKNASQVVDKETGEPKIMYHGTNSPTDFDTFEGSNYYFVSPDVEFANAYANAKNGRVIPLFINAKKIFSPSNLSDKEESEIFDIIEKEQLDKGRSDDYAYDTAWQFIKSLTGAGDNWSTVESDVIKKYVIDNKYDAIAVRETGSDNIAVTYSNQLKSATANTGEFSTEDNRLQFQKIPTKTKFNSNIKEEVDRIKSLGIADEDGDTRNLDGTKYTGGGLVIPASSVNTNQGRLNPSSLFDFLNKNKSKVSNGSSFKIGLYKFPNQDTVSIDLNIVSSPKNRAIAIEFARLAGQESIFDLDTFENIKTGADGMNPINFTDEQFAEIGNAFAEDRMPNVFGKLQLQRGTPTRKVGLRTKSKFVNRVSNKLERIRQNLFTVSGVLGKTVKVLQEKMAGNIAAEINKAQRLGGKTKKLIEKYKNVITAQQVTDYLTGVPPQPGSRQMPPSLAMALDEMREHIDGLTEQLITLGVIDDAETIALYRENKGKYMLRSYELFNVPTGLLDKANGNKSPEIDIDNAISKLRNVDQAVIDNALMYLANQEMPKVQQKNPTLSLAEQFKLAKEQAKFKANEILTREEVGYSTKSVAGSVNVKSISERQDIAPEIRALMGEYTDPLYNYYSTIFKIASLTSSRDYLNKLKEVGYNKFLFDENSPNRPTTGTVPVAANESEFLRPLNGLYTFPELYNALKKASAESPNLYRQIAGRVRKYKTVYNPATHIVNVIGNMGFAFSNGHWNELPETYKALAGYLSGSDSPKIIKLIDTLNREGVLGNSVGVNELKQYFDKNKSLDDLLKVTYGAASKVEKVFKGLTKARIAAEKAYQIEDDVFKILAFVNESNRYAKAIYGKKYMDLNPTQMADISDKAGEIVKNTYPTFSRVPKFIKGLSKELFLGNFLSFPAESIRNSYNTLELAMKEIASGNGKLAAVGTSRLVGTLAYNGVFSALNYYGFSLAGAGITGLIGAFADDDEERKKKKQIMKQVAPWNQESADLYISKFKDGKLVYYDIGRLNSFKYQSDVFGTFFSNMGNKEGAIKSSYRTVAKALEPVFDVDLTYDALIAMKNNEVEETGQKIYNPEQGGGEFDRSTNRSIAYGKYMMKKFGPGIITNAMKMYDYYGKDSDKFKDEVVSTFGPRKYTVDLTQNFYFNLKGPSRGGANNRVGFVERLEDAKRLYNKYDTSLSEGEKEVKYQEAIAAYKRVLADAREYYRGAIAGGAIPEELITKLKISKIGGGNDKVAIGTIMRDDDMSLSDNAYIIR